MSEFNNELRAIVVGTGSLLDEMKSLSVESGYGDRFYFSGSVPHDFISSFHFISDVYVSTNIDGNLTNANLEAIAANTCMIIPSAQHDKFIDVKTSEYLSNCVSYFEVGSPEDLKDKVLYLIKNPHEKNVFSDRLSNQKKTFLRSWDERVQEEFRIINNLIS